jgi:hypothetical protein
MTSAFTLSAGSERSSYTCLFLASFSILFLELVLIRWIPAYLRTFGFFTNFVLLASLLGAGAGILAHRGARIPVPPLAATLLALVVFVVEERWNLNLPTTKVLFYGAGLQNSESYWQIPVVFILLVLVFMPLGQRLGAVLSILPPLRAYTVDILGSLAGIASFVVLALLSLPPIVWFLAFIAAAWTLIAGTSFRRKLLDGALLACTCGVVFLFGLSKFWDATDQTVWSPYYRIVYYPNSAKDGYIVAVNNVGHQETRPVRFKESFYFEPYRIFGSRTFKRALIIGAGTGSDVAIALANGVEYIDAVEIDPKLYGLGTQLNPERPYADPRVSMHINDGRAFIRHTDAKYDLIIFALTDSLTLTSSQANLRLESFLFTTESLREATQHLAPDGLLVLYNYYRQNWSISKLASMVFAATGSAPYVVTYGDIGRAATVMAGPRLRSLPPDRDHPYREAESTGATHESALGAELPHIGDGRLDGSSTLAQATDDWPFFYVQEPGLPRIYALGIGMVVLTALGVVMGLTPAVLLRRFDWHFFFLGAAFMVLETRSLVTFALLFGTTWLVNALVFFAILTSVLLAILINAAWRLVNVLPLYISLFALLALNYLLPVNTLLDIASPALRYTLASSLTFAPVFVANIVFSRSFRDSAEADAAFGSNLIGIMAGGLIEYTALVWGYQSLLIPVAACYTMALLLFHRLAPVKVA